MIHHSFSYFACKTICSISVENIEPEIEAQPEPIVEEQPSSLSPEEAKKQVTM
jgi:hypothetical protein